MKKLFNKEKLISILENFKVVKDNEIWIHHPITEDLIQVKVKEVGKEYVTVSILENSDYFGQPDFKIKKTSIIGIN